MTLLDVSQRAIHALPLLPKRLQEYFRALLIRSRPFFQERTIVLGRAADAIAPSQAVHHQSSRGTDQSRASGRVFFKEREMPLDEASPQSRILS
jgi:hypothetical protein